MPAKNRTTDLRSSRRQFLEQSGAAALAAGLAAAGCGGSGDRSSAKRRPNILFLLTDDQRWDTVGAMGNPVAKTPHMDRLAREGVLFTNSFVTTSICAVSRASIFTGLYARCHGIHEFQTPLSEEQHALSYPVRLRQAGYRTGFIGKHGVGADAPNDRFDYFRGFAGQGQYFTEADGKPIHLTTLMGNQALEFLDGCSADQPFNLSVSFKAPHVQDGEPPYFLSDPAYDDVYQGVNFTPYKQNDARYFEQLPEFLKKTENRVRWEQRFSTPEKWQESMRRYYTLIYGVDVQIGRMMDALEQRGWLDNTVVVFTADNGFYLGERGLAGKWFMHEESIRTPLIIRDPRRTETRGTRRGEMALNIDISPTLLSLAGLDIPPAVNGRDLTPLVAGESPAWRKDWFYEHLFEHPGIPKTEGVRTERWSYCRFIESEPLYEELYDLETDPDEDKNLATSAEHAEQLEIMRQRRQAWLKSLEGWDIHKPWREP